MKRELDLQEYVTRGVETVVADALRATLRDPKESAFMLKFAAASRRASRTRLRHEREGLHVPAFLIASITSSCNLHCAGCYSRCGHATVDSAPVRQLTAGDWLNVFRQADELGVSFILLAGGEPMLRRDVIEAAGGMGNILFPIFTNGTFLDEAYYTLLERRRNLIPVMSIEGGREQTDARRGAGIYDRLLTNMDELDRRGLIDGASVTVTKENLSHVCSGAFLHTLADRGCRAVFFIEFVPVSEEGACLAPDDSDRAYMRGQIERLRRERPEMLFLSFPGDEKSSGGCLAAGRGFFHINSHGGAEPCPFSAYSDVNVKDASLRSALDSDLFSALRDGHILEEDHDGGCVLFARRAQVEELAGRLSAKTNT